MRTRWLGLIAIAMLVGSTYWVGCGGDENTTNFSGNVSSVSPALAALPPQKDSRFAIHWLKLQSEAYAQGACGTGGRLLFCIQTSTLSACDRVDAGCTFEIETAIERDRDTVTMTFVDDTNGNRVGDTGEAKSTVAQSMRYCNGDQVVIANADVNFTTGFTTASVTKRVDRCTGLVATQTPRGTVTPARTNTPNGSPTATRTGTLSPTATRTPTSYLASNSLNQPPSNMLAFLFSAGALGVLIPRRRRPSGAK
jgi:hypothetical protein